MQIAEFWPPAQFLLNAGAVCHQGWQVACPARAHPDGDGVAGDLASHFDDLHHAVACAVAQVVDAAVAIGQRFQRQDVRVCQVQHMNVIADAGSIGRIVIIAIYRNGVALAQCHLQHQRDEVRFRGMIFPDVAVGMSAAGVEVAQAAVL